MADEDQVFHHLTAPVESVEEYRLGGYRPVYLKDSLLNGRYLVLRKLGYGSYSTTWLARDRELSRFVALKIKKAKGCDDHEISIYDDLAIRDTEGMGMHVIQLIDHFILHGPNGSHSCLVFPAMGPRVIGLLHDHIPVEGTLLCKSKRFSVLAARQILLQALMGLEYLRKKNIVHGDFHAGNWLLELQDINELSEEDLLQDPDKISAPVQRLDGKQNAGDPRYLTLDEPLYRWVAIGANLCVRIADLGNAFPINKPPDDPQTPVDIRSPELLLAKEISKSQDVWSFGCIVYRFLTNTTLFPLFNMGNPEVLDDSHVLQLIELLGPLPDNLKHAWLNYDQYFDEHDVQTSFRNEWAPEIDFTSSNTPSVDGNDNELENENSVGEGVEQRFIDDEDPMPRPDQCPFPAHLVPSIVEIYEDTSLQDDEDGIGDESDIYTPDLPLAGRFMRDKHPDMSQGEAEAAVDLLQQILRYDPAERPTTTDLLRHPWIVEFCSGNGDSAAVTIASPRETQHKRRRLTENLDVQVMETRKRILGKFQRE